MAGRAAINQDFLYAALGTPAYAAFFTESRMRRIDSNKLNRKSRSSKSQGKEEAREEGQATTPPPLYLGSRRGVSAEEYSNNPASHP
jgi:hypothetical protein